MPPSRAPAARDNDAAGPARLSGWAAWFFLISAASYLLYPAWLLPISTLGRLAVFLGLCAISITCSLSARFVLRTAPSLPDRNSPAKVEPAGLPFILCLTVASCAALHLYPLFWPVQTRGDEGTLALDGLAVLSAIPHRIPTTFLARVFAVVLAVAMIALFRFPEKTARLRSRLAAAAENPPLWAVIACCLALGVALFALLRRHDYSPSLVRYPPFYKLIAAFCYALFGVHAASARVHQLVFSLGAGVYLFKLVNLHRDTRMSLLSSAAFLFCPVVFYFGNLAHMESGVLFFCMISSYYFLKGLRDSSSRDLALSSLLLYAGFFYKQPVAFCLIIFNLHLLLHRSVPTSLKAFHLKLSAVCIAGFIPWLIIGSKYCWRNYFFTPDNWTHASLALKYLKEVPHHVGYVPATVFALGLAYSLYQKRDPLTRFLFIWLCAWHAFYTSDSPRWMGNDRFASILYPAFAVFSSQAVSDFADRLSSRLSASALRLGFVGLGLLSCTVFPLPPIDARYATYYRPEERFVPYDQALSYIKQNIPVGKPGRQRKVSQSC